MKEIIATLDDLGLPTRTRNVYARAGYIEIKDLLSAKVTWILDARNAGPARYNELVKALMKAELVPNDFCLWEDVPHQERKILAEISFSELTESWLATYGQPGSDGDITAGFG